MSDMRLSSMVRHGSLLAVVVAALVLASSAMAAPSVDTYGGQGGQTQGQLESNNPAGPGSGSRAATASGNTASTDTDGALPFTGLDLALMLGGGVVLLAVGASMAKLTPRSHSS